MSCVLNMVTPNHSRSTITARIKILIKVWRGPYRFHRKGNETFEITRNEKDKLDNNIVKEYLKLKDLNISFPKIVNFYMSKGVNNKVCKIDGVSKRAFVGLKQISISSNDDGDDENAFI